MQKQVSMLLDCLNTIKDDRYNNLPPRPVQEGEEPEQPRTLQDMYEQLLQWLGCHLELEIQIVTPPFQKNTHKALQDTFELSFLQEDPWDWFTSAAEKFGTPFLMQMERDKARRLMQMFEEEQRMIPSIQDKIVIDPCAGTGGLILTHAAKMGSNLIFYGAEKNIVAYRTALINMKIYNVKCFLLHADYTQHDLSAGSMNWLSSNMWNPLAFADLYEKPQN